jgi:hypothetical protein
MTAPKSDDRDDAPAGEPLTPEGLALLGRARRSFGISIGILLLGFMAITLALVYRVMRDAPPPAMVAEVALPSGSEIVSSMIVDGVLNVTYRVGDDVTLALFHAETGEARGSISLGAE